MDATELEYDFGLSDGAMEEVGERTNRLSYLSDKSSGESLGSIYEMERAREQSGEEQLRFDELSLRMGTVVAGLNDPSLSSVFSSALYCSLMMLTGCKGR